MDPESIRVEYEVLHHAGHPVGGIRGVIADAEPERASRASDMKNTPLATARLEKSMTLGPKFQGPRTSLIEAEIDPHAK
jgi:hypothetical protein